MTKIKLKPTLILQYKTPDKYPDTDVYWITEKGDHKGHGFLTVDMQIGLIRCPECLRENYAPNVTSGFCSWCGFDAMTTMPDSEA